MANTSFLKKIYHKLLPGKTCKKDVRGNGNTFTIHPSVIFRNCSIKISGDNNSLHIKEGGFFNNVTFYIQGSKNEIVINEDVKFIRGGELWVEDQNCAIKIGAKSTFEEVHIAVTEPGSAISIGEDCMFANDIDIRTGDSHSIVDAATMKRVNFAKNVEIGDHVWIASHVSILKGVRILENSVVATRSVVTGPVDQKGVLIAGVPSRVVKENISWDRRRLDNKS